MKSSVVALSPKARLAADPALFDRMMNYNHSALIERMVVKIGWTPERANEAFEEMKKFLYLCATNEGAMAPPEDIDEIWHNFILFTKDYHDFCMKSVGAFLHHQPLTVAERASSDGSMIQNTLNAAKYAFGDNLSAAYWEFSKVPGSCGVGVCGASTNCQS